jgi:putative membrane protein
MDRPTWQCEGEEPDYRFSLANERTFLAWIRTTLALMAGGLLLDQVALKNPGQILLPAVAIFSCVTAAVMSIFAFMRWKANEIAMRHKKSLPASPILPAVSVVLAAAALVVAFSMLHLL